MIEFKDLKKVIIKSCKSVDISDLNDAYKFIVNGEKLNKILSQVVENKEENIRIIRLENKETESGFVVPSKVPEYNFDEIEDILEYVQSTTELKDIFNGKTHIVRFILMITEDETINPVASLEDFIEKPVYRVLIVHKFNKKREKFEYSIYFRSNKAMMQYINTLKENGNVFNNIKDYSEE